MINRQQGFTLLEVARRRWRFSQCLACWRLWSHKLPSCINAHEEISSSISYNAPSPFLITISCNWSPGGIGTDKIVVLVKKLFFTAQSRDPLAPLSEASQTLLTVHWYLRNHTLYRAVRTSGCRKDQPAQAMLEHVESFLLESNSGESKNILSQSRHLKTQQYGGYSVLHYLSS